MAITDSVIATFSVVKNVKIKLKASRNIAFIKP